MVIESVLMWSYQDAHSLMNLSLYLYNIPTHSDLFASLPTCGTGRANQKQFIGDSIHLIAVSQYAGCRDATGSLCEVNDEFCRI